MNLLLQILPEEIQLIISRKLNELHGDENWELPKFFEILKVEIKVREESSTGKTVSKRSANATAAACTYYCKHWENLLYILCKGNHHTVEYHVVTNIQERKKMFRRAGRFFCLRKVEHSARNCDACIKCF